jgi:hypothetical protein
MPPAPDQTILFTVTPRALAIGKGKLPISVFVSPRLHGADTLDAFEDWRHWTKLIADHGLTLEFTCGAQTTTLSVDPAKLEPRLWAALFKSKTLVRSHSFDDYSGRAVVSYSVRGALGALKSIYQRAAVQLALPDGGGRDQREGGNRRLLGELIQGLEVHWSDALRAELRAIEQSGRDLNSVWDYSPLDSEGLPTGPPTRARNQAAALPFAAFHHMPTPPYDTPLGKDWKTYIDFHQALTSLNGYPALQRALGIVFDLELPETAVPVTEPGKYETLFVSAVDPGWPWSIEPSIPQLQTCVVNLQLTAESRAFLAAPRVLAEPAAPVEVIGLLDLDPRRFGLAQVDVDGGMHKAIMLAETWSPDPASPRSLDDEPLPAPAPHPEVFDPEATTPALRSGGFSLFADGRGQTLLDTISRSKGFNDAVEGTGPAKPLFAEDLVRGYRLDIWDSWSDEWHSLHSRTEEYEVGARSYDAGVHEGFVQLAATQQAPGADPASDDLYLHEAIARWAGWSLSVPMPGKHLSRYADAARAVPPDNDDPDYRVNEPVTPFKIVPTFQIVQGSLPRLRFGTRYRLRARAVDLAGNSLVPDGSVAGELAALMGLPRDPDGFPYLRYEPVPAPLVVARDAQAFTGPGSALDRIVLRSFNAAPGDDGSPADSTAADRHLLPPRTSIELGERLGMFDDPTGKLKSDAATYELIVDRDAGELHHVSIDVAGKPDERPLEPGERVDALPYLPDPLSHGVALRDLPGTPAGTIGNAPSAAGAVEFTPLADPNPRPGSTTIVEFPSAGDWQTLEGIRLALQEPDAADPEQMPSWDPVARLLTVYLAKGQMTTVALSSYVRSTDLHLFGQWQWLREYLDNVAANEPRRELLLPGADVDRVAHVLQRAVEGGHWLLTPPVLLTFVHAIQQPLGRPQFTAATIEYDPDKAAWDSCPLQTAPSRGRTDPTELAPITAYRRLGATDAYLIGALDVHGAGTAKLDLEATWTDPVDEGPKWNWVDHRAHVDELPLPRPVESYLTAPSGKDMRRVGYYDSEHDQIVFVRAGEWTGRPGYNEIDFDNAAPRHVLGDPRRHRVKYTAIATSRYSEYFAPDAPGGFTRMSDPVLVDVPASARPLAPDVVYVVPTFGWQRQTDTNLMRSVRFGGGLRVYLRRPWFSSGEGELLGVALWSSENGALDRNKFKPYITQWGMDPIWQTAGLSGTPGYWSFPDAVSTDYSVTLEEGAGVVDVVGFEPEFDGSRDLWFADLTVDTPGETYMPFVRLALVRYQPHALADAEISRVVLADFAQLTPDRTATVTIDPYHPRQMNVAVSGVAPRGPAPQQTNIVVRVQQRDETIDSDLGWSDAPATLVTVTVDADGTAPSDPDLALWTGTVRFAEDPDPGRYRILIAEYEHLTTYGRSGASDGPNRLVYAETFTLDNF